MRFASVTIGTSRIAWPIVAVGIAAAPMVAVLGVRSLVHKKAPVTSSNVGGLAVGGQFSPPAMPQPAAEAVGIQMSFNSECAQPFGPSPMVTHTPPKPVETKEPAATTPTIAEKPVDPAQPVTPPSVTLSSIMSGQGQPFAVISGRVRRVGDQVGNGFVITAIDGQAGSVEIANGDVKATLVLKNLRGE